MGRARRNPFTPDYGVPPPVMAGRDSELKILSKMAADLDSGAMVRSVVFYGPRGNGKTALLNSSESYKPKRTRLKIVQTRSQHLRAPRELLGLLLDLTVSPASQLGKVGRSVDVLGERVTGDRQFTDWQDHMGIGVALQSLSMRRKIRVPTLLLLDEAHDLDRNIGRIVLAIVSRMEAEQIPFGLVLSGTPGVHRRLSELESSINERAHFVRVSTLDDTATRKALFEPFENAGFSIELTEEETDRLLEWAQNYPYFIQELGFILFDVAKARGEKCIRGDFLQIAKQEFDLATEYMYGKRIDELNRRGLIKPAVAVAKATLERATSVSRKDLCNSVENCTDGRSPEGILDELIELGFIWESADSNQRYEAGIPSLMNNIVSKESDLPV